MGKGLLALGSVLKAQCLNMGEHTGLEAKGRPRRDPSLEQPPHDALSQQR